MKSGIRISKSEVSEAIWQRILSTVIIHDISFGNLLKSKVTELWIPIDHKIGISLYNDNGRIW